MADRQRGTPTGSLHVICPPLIGEMLIDQLAAEFVIAEPHVRLHLDAGMTVFDPRPASADLIIYPTFEPLPNSDVIARRIFTNEYVLAASPQFLDGRSLRDPQALKSFECLGLGSPASEWVWRLKRGREAALHRFTPRFTTTQLSALRQAVRSGLGIAALPTAICTGDFRSGRLVRVLNDWTPAPVTFYAVYPSAGTLSLAARRFLNLVVRRLRAAYQSV